MTLSEAPAGRLTLHVDGPIAWLVIDNVAKRNAMTRAMWLSVPPLIARAAADTAVRSLCITGAGEHFCAGADLQELSAIRATAAPVGDPGDRDQVVLAAEQAITSFPKPSLALVDGACIGGGSQIAAACDLRFATRRARFGVPPGRLGIVYPASSLRRLTELVGPAAAKWLLFSGEPIDAEHALRIGLVDEVLDPQHTRTRAEAFLAGLAERSQLTLTAAKDMIDAAARGEHLDSRTRHWNRLAEEASDEAEGVAAVLERRAPRFTWVHPG